MYEYMSDRENTYALYDMIKHLEHKADQWERYLRAMEDKRCQLAYWADMTDADEAWDLYESVERPCKKIEELLESAKIGIKALEDAYNEVQYIEDSGAWGA